MVRSSTGGISLPISRSHDLTISLLLKVQTAFAGGVRQRFDSSMIEEAAPVEDDFLNTCGFGALGDEFADGFCAIQIAALDGSAQSRVYRGSRRQRAPGLIVNHLSINMQVRAKYIQTGPFRVPLNAPADTGMPPLSRDTSALGRGPPPATTAGLRTGIRPPSPACRR